MPINDLLISVASSPMAVELLKDWRGRAKGTRPDKEQLRRSVKVAVATEASLSHRLPVAELVPLPDPATAQDVGEFVGMLRQVRAYSGLTLREIEERGERYQLPRSSVGDMLRKKNPKLPTRPERMAHYLAVCGLDEDQITKWEAARRRLAMEQAL